MSNIKDIGTKLVDLCNQGKNDEVIETLYADDIVSVEAAAGQFPREVKGKGQVVEKGAWWAENHEVHGGTATGPYPHGDDRFAVIFAYDITHKPSGQRFKMDEVAVYHVAGGKIVREEFFYSAG
jgi:ketosteroid isomerase-like protein